jgi:hypothetical protein
MKLKKLDARMNGYGNFKYVAKFRKRGDREKFIAIRNWCWEQWGPSCELEFWKEDVNPAWSWAVTEFETKIYIDSDKEASWYILKWS